MRAACILPVLMVLALVACSPPAAHAVAPPPPTASAPLPAPAATAEPSMGVVAATAEAAARLRSLPHAPFNIGVPAGDAYYPFSLAVDAEKQLAYIYHADSAEKRPVISVVDLGTGQVARVIRLGQTRPGASGRLFLAPDGKRLFLQENQDNTLTTIDTSTGALRTLLTGVTDAELSADGRVLYVIGRESAAAYPLADLLLGRANPAWKVNGPFVRLALGGDRLLARTWGSAGSLYLLDAATGKQLARGDAPEMTDAISPGPDGGWAAIAGGEKPRLIRYDASLKNLGETELLYTSYLNYDAARSRYLVGGFRYPEGEPLGHPVILSIDAGDGKLLDEQRWPRETGPAVFVPWGEDALLAFAPGGPAAVDVLDPATLSSQKRIVTGAWAKDVVIDEPAQRLYVADDLGRIHVLQLPRGEEVALWEGGEPLVLDRANGRLYANRPAGVVALDLRTGDVLAQFPQRGYPAPDPNADLVYLANRGVTIYDRSGKQVGTIPSTFPVERGMVPNPYAYAVQVNPVTGHVAVILNNGIPGSNGGSFLRIYPRQSDKAVEPPAPHSFVMDLTTDSKGKWYVAYSPARTQEAVQVLSPDGRQLDRLDHRTGALFLEEGSDNLYLFGDGRVTRLEASTLTPVDLFEGPQFVSTIAFSPTARTAYLVGSSGSLVTPLALEGLEPLDLRPLPGKPSSDASNDGLSVTGQGRRRLLIARFLESYRTTDGETWDRLLPGTDLTLSFATAVGPQTIFVTGRSTAGGEGVWRSTDGGNTWEWLTAGLPISFPTSPSSPTVRTRPISSIARRACCAGIRPPPGGGW